MQIMVYAFSSNDSGFSLIPCVLEVSSIKLDVKSGSTVFQLYNGGTFVMPFLSVDDYVDSLSVLMNCGFYDFSEGGYFSYPDCENVHLLPCDQQIEYNDAPDFVLKFYNRRLFPLTFEEIVLDGVLDKEIYNKMLDEMHSFEIKKGEPKKGETKKGETKNPKVIKLDVFGDES